MPVEYGIANIIIVALMELEMTAALNLDTAKKDKNDEIVLILSKNVILKVNVRKQ